jgi:fructose-bisphosphate aldolase/2-amino-3,7-dideoxy-D-threo-hept-6-ulosonate synthase
VSESRLRLRRIMDPASGRAVLLSFTSAMEVGVVRGMADLPGTVGALAAGGNVTGIVVHSGVVGRLFQEQPDLPCGIVVDLFGGTWMTTQLIRREQICTLEHAVRVGADAVLVTVALGSADGARQLRLCGQIARECADWGMPLIVRVDTMETDARRQFSATLSGHGARMAYEIGADMVEVNYSGDQQAFAEALRGVDIPVLIGGAPNLATDASLVESVRQAVAAGASGVDLAASMFWYDGPTPALAEVAGIVRGQSVEVTA